MFLSRRDNMLQKTVRAQASWRQKHHPPVVICIVATAGVGMGSTKDTINAVVNAVRFARGRMRFNSI